MKSYKTPPNHKYLLLKGIYMSRVKDWQKELLMVCLE